MRKCINTFLKLLKILCMSSTLRGGWLVHKRYHFRSESSLIIMYSFFFFSLERWQQTSIESWLCARHNSKVLTPLGDSFNTTPIVQIQSLRPTCSDPHELQASLEPRESVLLREQKEGREGDNGQRIWLLLFNFKNFCTIQMFCHNAEFHCNVFKTSKPSFDSYENHPF